MKRIWLGIFAGIVLGEAVLNMLVPDQKEISRSQMEGRISGIDERDGMLVLYVDDVMVWADAGCAADFVLPESTAAVSGTGSGISGQSDVSGASGQSDVSGASGPADDFGVPGFRIGNKVLVTGDIEAIEGPRNPGEFDYRTYYRSLGYRYRCYAERIQVTDSSCNYIRQGIHELRKRLLSSIDSVYDAEDAGVLKAALLGDKSGMDPDLYDSYRKNGIAHLLAISGLHIAIIGMTLNRLLRRSGMGRTAAGCISAVFLFIYLFLTGSPVSTVRAVMMLCMVFLSGAEGRTYDLLSSAGLAGTVILLANRWQLFSCGFLLSFGAVLSIGGPALSVIRKYHIRNPVLMSLVVSVTVQAFTLPVTAFFFFELPLFGWILNLIVIPLMTYVVWSGLAAMLLCPLCLPAAEFAAGTGHYILSFYIFLLRRMEKLPLTTIVTGRPTLWQSGIYYIVLCYIFWRLLRFSSGRLPEQK